jgi:hypothetical protein
MIFQLCKHTAHHRASSCDLLAANVRPAFFPAYSLILAPQRCHLSKYCKKADMLSATNRVCTPAAQDARVQARFTSSRHASHQSISMCAHLSSEAHGLSSRKHTAAGLRTPLSAAQRAPALCSPCARAGTRVM